MNTFSYLMLVVALAVSNCLANETITDTVSPYDKSKAIFNANVTTITGIINSLKDSLANAKKQYDKIVYDKNTATNNVKKYMQAIAILEQQLAETQTNLKNATTTVMMCESKIGNINATLGQAVDGQSTSIATSMTAILTASDQMNTLAANSTTADKHKLEAGNAKKQAQSLQNSLENLKKDISSARMQYAAAGTQASAPVLTQQTAQQN